MNTNKQYNYIYEKTEKERAKRSIKRKTRKHYPLINQRCVKCGKEANCRHHYIINSKKQIAFNVFDFFCSNCHKLEHKFLRQISSKL